MFRLYFYPVFDSYLLVAAVALLLLGLMWFGPSREKTGRGRRAMIALLRAVVIAMVLLLMLRPTLVYTHTEKQAATLVVLVDQSRSMSVPDAVGDTTRWNALRSALGDAAPALAKLQDEFELKAYTFDADVHEVRAERGKIELPEKPEGRQTAIGAVLDEVLRREAGKRLLGVVLLSDGAQRAYAPHDLPPQTAAARLRQLGYPMFTLPFGQSRGLGEARDVAVKDLVVSPSVFVKNELAITGNVRVDGYVNADIPVQVLFETSPGKMEVVAEQKIRADADGQLIPIKLSYIPEVPGEHKAHAPGRRPARRVGDHQQRVEHFRQRAQGRAERVVHRRDVAGRAEIYPPRARFLARHQGRLRAARSPRPEEPPRRLRRPFQAGQVRRLHPRRRRFDGLPGG